jgi:two-component system NarL family sensor kinase
MAWAIAWSIAAWSIMPRVAAAPAPVGDQVLPNDWSAPLLVLTLVLVGGLVLLRERTHPYGWWLLGMGVAIAPVGFLGLYALYALYVEPGAGLPLVLPAAWLQELGAWVSMAVGWLVLPCLFPDGHQLPGRWGTAFRWALGSWTAWVLVFMLMDRPLENWLMDLPRVPTNPTGILPLPFAIGAGWWALNMAGSGVIALGTLRGRWRTADADLRQRMKWPLLVFVLLGAGVLVEIADALLVEGLGIDLGIRPVLDLLAVPTTVAFVVALGLGVLRYRLYDVDRVINRTLVYAILTVAVFVTYILLVVGVGSLVPDSNGLGLSLVATGLVAVAFAPARRRLQAAANRLMFGQRDEPYAVLSRLGDVLAGAGTPDEALQTLAETVGASLKLPWVAIELDQRDGQVVRAEHGRADAVAAEPLTLPLEHGEERVGRLVVAPRSDGGTLAPPDRRILDDVAHQAGALAATARLTRDLQVSRERLVLAREEERRRIRRDLHDGLGPTLAAQALALDVAADRVAGDPVARELLVRLKQDTQSLVADIRRLVHDLRPPALDELGLSGALVAHVAQVDGSGAVAIRVRTDPAPLPDLSAAVEVAAWRIVREALTNVVRHADATTCAVTLALEDGHLAVQVVDDGVGLPVVPRAGIGLQSMRDRAEELGGTLTATDAPGGGTAIHAALPIGARPDGPSPAPSGEHLEVAHDG